MTYDLAISVILHVKDFLYLECYMKTLQEWSNGWLVENWFTVFQLLKVQNTNCIRIAILFNFKIKNMVWVYTKAVFFLYFVANKLISTKLYPYHAAVSFQYSFHKLAAYSIICQPETIWIQPHDQQEVQ